MRTLVAVVAPVLVAQWGFSRKSLDKTGAIAGTIPITYLQHTV